jgi:hypothetical protein
LSIPASKALSENSACPKKEKGNRRKTIIKAFIYISKKVEEKIPLPLKFININ